ncbi:hypothetical protein ACFOY2_06485, partial [Nonomuraea purpurea]
MRTGYSTALMCHRLGSGAVTSIEYDPVIADRAKTALTIAGYMPFLVQGDGLHGYERRAPYDLLIVRHEAPCNRVEVKDLHRSVVAATEMKPRAA